MKRTKSRSDMTWPHSCRAFPAAASAGLVRRSALRFARLPTAARPNSESLPHLVMGAGGGVSPCLAAPLLGPQPPDELAYSAMVFTLSPSCRRVDSSPPFPERSSLFVPAKREFHRTHPITRGTRPLHITAVPGGAIFWGEYFDNPARDQVHIYASTDDGATWSVAYTFPKGAIRHVHNIVHDPWGDCLWVLTGDYGDECRILRATCDFRR